MLAAGASVGSDDRQKLDGQRLFGKVHPLSRIQYPSRTACFDAGTHAVDTKGCTAEVRH